MKTSKQSKFALGLGVMVAFALTLSAPVKAQEKPEEINLTGFYMETGPTFSTGFGGSAKNSNSFFRDPKKQGNDGQSAGGAIGLGYDFKWFGVGSKIRGEVALSGREGGNIGFQYIDWDILEARLYIADLFRENPSRLRPYLVASGGYNLNSFSIAGLHFGFGAGVQYLIGSNLYVGAEAIFRQRIEDEFVPTLGAGATVGFRF